MVAIGRVTTCTYKKNAEARSAAHLAQLLGREPAAVQGVAGVADELGIHALRGPHTVHGGTLDTCRRKHYHGKEKKQHQATVSSDEAPFSQASKRNS